MDRATRELVAQRASDRCEYCGLRQAMSPLAKLQVEHITPRKHGGGDDPANLALACIDCDLRKGPNLTGVDPTTGEITALFNPRDQVWATTSGGTASTSSGPRLLAGPPSECST